MSIYGPLPAQARTFAFRFDHADSLLRSPELAEALRGVAPGLWTETLAPMVVRDPATPVATLLIAARIGALRDSVLADPRVRRDPAMVLRVPSGGASDTAWREAFLDAVQASGGARTVSSDVLRQVVGAMVYDGSHPALARQLVADRRVRASDSLLLTLIRSFPQRYPAARRDALRVLLSRRTIPDTVLTALDWWSVRPDLLDTAPRRLRPLLATQLWELAEHAPDELKVRAARMLLRDPHTKPGTVHDIADEVAYNEERCHPKAYPSEELEMAALRHPAAKREPGLLQTLMSVPNPRVRLAAIVKMAGDPPPPRLVERQAMQVEGARYLAARAASRHLETSGAAYVDSVRAVLSRWARMRPPPPELAGWRRVVAENPSPGALARRILAFDTPMVRLRRHSPFTELLPPAERAGADNVHCED